MTLALFIIAFVLGAIAFLLTLGNIDHPMRAHSTSAAVALTAVFLAAAVVLRVMEILAEAIT